MHFSRSWKYTILPPTISSHELFDHFGSARMGVAAKVVIGDRVYLKCWQFSMLVEVWAMAIPLLL